MAQKPIRVTGSVVRRILAEFFSESAFNTMAYGVFYLGYVTRMYPIERPVRQQLGDLGEVVLLHHRANPYYRFMRGLACFGYVQHVLFQTLQMIRFIPTEGFTLRVVYVIYYFGLQLLCSLSTYVTLMNENTLPYLWNCIEANTKMCQRCGVAEAAKWKYAPIAMLIMIPVTLGSTVVGFGMALLFALKPNLPAHMFYVLPESWKAYTAAYLTLLFWQTFLIVAGLTAINYFVTIAVAFIFGTKVAAVQVTSSSGLSVLVKMQIFRSLEMANQLFDQIGRNFYFPVLSFVTVAVGVTFTYIALTRFGDPRLPLPVYTAVIACDVMIFVAITLGFVQVGKCSDASAEFIESIRTALKEEATLGDPRLQYLRKKLAALRPFDLNVGSYAKINIHTVKLLHETIVDYLMLFLKL